jgi:hypothetical protein
MNWVRSASGRVQHLVATGGIVLAGWLVFGRVATQLGHVGDSWSYLSLIERWGPYSITTTQAGRVALPLAWALGYALGHGDPWIYHVLAACLITGSAVCLYQTLVLLWPSHVGFAFQAAVLSILWPADPTRFDIATLGNRQALFFYSLGLLGFVVALRKRNLVILGASAITLLVSLLTYEAQLLLILTCPLLLLIPGVRPDPKQRKWFVCAALVPCGVWAVVNLLVYAGAADRGTYQTDLLTSQSLLRVPAQLVDGVRLLLVDAWRLPLTLLHSDAVPDVAFVAWAAPATGVCMLCVTALALCVRQGASPPARSPALILVLMATLWMALGFSLFVVTPIATGEPGRAHTFSAAWAAVAVCGCVAMLAQRVIGGRSTRARLGREVFAIAAAMPLVVLFLAMTAVYQRNFRQSWEEQRTLLGELTTLAPDIHDGALVIVSGLPSTRIILPSGYTCEFALTYLEGHVPLPPGARRTATSGAELATQRINCALLFTDRDLDPLVHVEFQPTGVVEHFPPLDYEFSYGQIIAFHYDDADGGSLTLLNRLPPEWLPPGAPKNQYDPTRLFDSAPRPSAPVNFLGDNT